MKLHFTCLMLFINLTTYLFGQKATVMTIQKISGSYTKTLNLPIDTRILKYNDHVVLLRLDSIKNGYWYGNNGKDSVVTKEINIVNLRGPKEILKYTSLTVCTASTLAATFFTIYAFNHPVVIDGSNENYKYVGMGYMAIFGALGTTIYFYPRTRFNTNNYKFQTH